MRKARGPLWWYELRFGVSWQFGALICLVSLALIVSAVAGIPQWLVHRQNETGAACTANGGVIVFERSARGGTTIPICHRD